MAIKYHEKTRIFHLYNNEISYVIRIMENEQLEQLYYGKKIHDRDELVYLHEEIERAQMAICVNTPGILSMQYTKQEYPVYGTGDYRLPAATILQENGSRIVNFTYQSNRMYKGKKRLEPLPATYVEDDIEAETLEIVLFDSVMKTQLILSYTIFSEYPVITRNARFIQIGTSEIVLERALSASIEFPDMEFEMLQFSGLWARERYLKKRKLEMGIQSISSINGTCSSAEHNPFLILKRPEATEFQGEAYGFSLVYSGNFLAQVEVNTVEMTRVTMGINPENFAWVLKQGEEFQTPEIVLAYSNKGLNGLSQVYHSFYRSHLICKKWRDCSRPILLNNWEATYFDINEEKFIKIAEKAKEAGVELIVLDDGWFGNRINDKMGLGDWEANRERFPKGISGLSKKIEEMGLKFGIWMELEMVNKESDIYKEHPDWIIGVPNRFESHSRNQYVLDYSRAEVVDYIYKKITKVIRESKISYIKWDMNRNMTEPFCRTASAREQGMMMHRYILGVYGLYAKLTSEFPDILFESCAAGGARFDPGMLYFAPQTWCSDDTDANERIKIQYGTSFAYPLSTIGSHVSASPNHQLLRGTSLETRANVAYFGTFGYEMDLNSISEEEFCVVKEQILFMKKYRDLLQVYGKFYRLKNPFEGNDAAWIVVSPEKEEAIALYYQSLNQVNAPLIRLKLYGLDPEKLYKVKNINIGVNDIKHKDCEKTDSKKDMHVWYAYGDELMYVGIQIDRNELSRKGGDFSTMLYSLKEAVKK